MQLRRFLTGLTAAAVVALAGFSAQATTRFVAGAIDRVIEISGKNSLICSAGKVVDAKPMTATFPNSTRTLPGIEYTINCAKILKGDNVYPASEQPTTIKVKMYAGAPIKDFPKFSVGQEATFIVYGESVLGFRSIVDGNGGLFNIVEKDGKKVAESPSGRGIYFKNKNLEAKFLSVRPSAAKALRKGPLPAEGQEMPELNSEGDITPELLDEAIKTVLANK